MLRWMHGFKLKERRTARTGVKWVWLSRR